MEYNNLSLIAFVAIIIIGRLLFGIVRKHKPKSQSKRVRIPDQEPAKQIQSYAYDLSFDIPQKQAEGPQPIKKKNRKTAAPPKRAGIKAAESSMNQGNTPDKGQQKNLPVFSENPVVNGIIWAEVLTRTGTRKSVHR